MKYLKLIIILFIASLNFNLILKPLSLVCGGTQGVAIILNYFFKLDSSIVILVINLIMLLLSYIFLNKNVVYSSILASLIYPLFIKLTSGFSLFFVNKYMFIFVIIAGIISGITGGLVYRLGFSSGGMNSFNLLISKLFNIKISLSNFVVNFIIILISSISFGLKMSIYSVIVILISSFIINFILKRKRL